MLTLKRKPCWIIVGHYINLKLTDQFINLSGCCKLLVKLAQGMTWLFSTGKLSHGACGFINCAHCWISNWEKWLTALGPQGGPLELQVRCISVGFWSFVQGPCIEIYVKDLNYFSLCCTHGAHSKINLLVAWVNRGTTAIFSLRAL